MTATYNEEERFDSALNGATVRRILAQARPHWKVLTGFLASIILVAVMDSIFTFISKQIIDLGIIGQDRDLLVRLLTIYGSLIFVQAAGVFSFIYLAGRLGESIQFDLRSQMFDRLQNLSLSFYDRTPLGWLMSRMTSDTQRLSELISWGILDTTWGIFNITSAMVFMLAINWRMALIVFLILPILVGVALVFQRYILTEYRKVRRLNSQITGSYSENITGVRVSKALVREERNLEEFQVLSSDMFKAGFRAAWMSALFLPVIQLISAIAIGSIAWYGGWQATFGGMTIGGIQAFISYVTFMLWPLQEMARVYAEMQRAIASGERVFSLLDTESEIVDLPGAQEPADLRGEIVFENVDFYYEQEKPVLRNLNLRVRQGETIALVGPTGAGKSTIVNLVARFYEPSEGQIWIKGRNYLDWTLDGIQSRLGVMLQTPHLFSGTIRENIRYGKLSASDSEVEDAAKLSGAHQFIKRLEKGYDEEVGEGGVLLSVGQKQLLSLGRAILADPDIFIMDEATSSVDTLTEALIQHGMEQILSNRTSFVIAHRLSTIKGADRILVIEDGAIREQGSHAELIQQRGHYYQLYTRQFRRERTKEYLPYQASAAGTD
jgi:ATP-binding cassette subfamily B protein